MAWSSEHRLNNQRTVMMLWFLCMILEPLDAHSLSYNFTITPRPRPGQPWCEVQGQMDGGVFLSYDCGHAKIIFTSPLGEEVKTVKPWETQIETLRDIRDHLRDFTLEKPRVTDPLTLQARMTCRCEYDRHISGSWQFGLNRLMMDHPGGRWMKEKWGNDRAVTEFLKKVSMGDCPAWLQAFMVHWEKMLKTSASPTMGPPTVQPTATAIYLTTGIAAGSCQFCHNGHHNSLDPLQEENCCCPRSTGLASPLPTVSALGLLPCLLDPGTSCENSPLELGLPTLSHPFLLGLGIPSNPCPSLYLLILK
ncbi:hypothetical protein FD754_024108 [Muntiacus muntjak]|uniref:MHC class I-like antigen recognition-like domain-containing protein n=1 Tax=Muntiacus muntjak TaxID=9888 RepID=A0A5N3UQY6_MUNMU|nr:hypothetical protein FD754_024108 [Muntiacus muntjak]